MKLRHILTAFGLVILLCAACIPAAALSDPLPLTFVLDAGHGGEDGGAVSADGLRESEVNLSIAQRTDALLGLCGHRTVMTRDSETLVYPEQADTTRKRKRYDQQRRVTLINETENAVLVSIHQNQYATAGPSGAQVFYGKQPGSEVFAQYAQSLLSGLCEKQRQAVPISEDIYLMREADCPAILIECGFLSNPGDAALLRSEEYRKALSVYITAACMGCAEELVSSHGESEKRVLLHGMRE